MEPETNRQSTAAEPVKYTMKRRVCEAIELHAKHEYAIFTIDDQPDRSYYMLGIESSFGGYAYGWGAPGKSFKAFLAQVDLGYVLSKMVPNDREFDGEATTKAIRKEIIKLRRAKEIDRETARSEWPESEFEHVIDFHEWCQETEFFRDGHWEFHQECGGARTREFTALYKLFWPELSRVLLADVEQAERDAVMCPVGCGHRLKSHSTRYSSDAIRRMCGEGGCDCVFIASEENSDVIKGS